MIPEIFSTASLIGTAISSVKNARELAKDTSDTKLKDQLSDVYDSLLTLKERLLEQDEEIRTLKAELAAKATYVGPVAPEGFYYAVGDAEAKQHPVCPRCFQETPQKIGFIHTATGRCNLCKSQMIVQKKMQSNAVEFMARRQRFIRGY